MRWFVRVLVLFAMLALAGSAYAQSPNTAGLVVLVVDQSGAVVKDAAVNVVNSATGALREGVSGDEGTVTLAALPLVGAYTVTVTMPVVTELRAGHRTIPDAARRSGIS